MKPVQSLAGVIAAVTFISIAAGQAKVARPPFSPGSEGDLQQKLDVYVGHLKRGSVAERRQAVEALGRIGLSAKFDVPALVARLKAEHFWTRMYAAEDLWRIKRDPAAVAVMIKDLKDRDVQVRRSAARTLGGFGVQAKAAIPALTEALQDGSSFVRSSAALALWRINKHPDTIRTLVANVGDPESRGHTAVAAEALGEIGVDAKAAVPALREALKDKPPAYSVALALWKINKDAAAVPALIEGLQYPESGWAGGSAHDWALIGAEAKAAVPALLEALKHENSFMRMKAAEALGALGPDAKAAVPALLEALKAPTKEVIKPPGAAKGYLGLAAGAGLHGEPYIDKLIPGSPAVKAGLQVGDVLVGVNDTKIANAKQYRATMEQLALKPGDQVTLVIDRAGKKQTRITVTARKWPRPEERYVLPGFGRSRVAAAEALWKINKHPAAVSGLAGILNDPADGWWAAEALQRIGPEAKAAVPALIGVRKGENKSTRLYAASALGQIGAETEAILVLVEALKDRDATVRKFAATSLLKIKRDPAVIRVVMERVKDPNNAEALWLIAVVALTDALKDEDEQVRNSAAQWLKKIDPRTAKEGFALKHRN